MGDVSRHTTVTLDGRRFRWMRAVSKHTTVKLNESRFKTHNGYATVSSHTTDMLTVSSHTTDMRSVSCHTTDMRTVSRNNGYVRWETFQDTQRLRWMGDGFVG
eukprot:GHVL01002856.1.p1 GENE.GHVL01002856.1~~GHVL01002856.1.p1  ORF type:complete len:103 (-),score=20.66 GHVL01002856.1:7-315(-)